MIIIKDRSCVLNHMKKAKKVLSFFTIVGITLTMLPLNAFATGRIPTRLAGTSAAQTAVVIAEQTGWTGTAILASSEPYGESDALTAGPLAKFLNAPILLQEAGAMLNTDTKAELIKLNVKKVYVTSGTAVINQAVLDQLTGMGITVTSLAGVDRFETSVNIARKMVDLGAPVIKVAVVYGWLNQDALSISSIAAASNEPILLTEKTSVPASVQAFLTANVNVTSSDVIGGTGVISDSVEAQFPNATRHYGKTAYDTNNQVIKDFSSSLDFNNVYMANISTGIDAIIGAPLAAQTKSAIVLTDGTIHASDAATFVRSKLTTSSVVTALGGESVVPENVRMQLCSGLSPLPAVDLTKPGTITTVAGMYSHLGYSGDGGPATSSELNIPTSVAVDAYGNVYIADGMNKRVRKVDEKGVITTVAGNGTSGYSGDGGPATSAELNYPNSVALDTSGNIYIIDGGEHIRKVDGKGIITTVADLEYATNMAVDASGNIYCTIWKENRVCKVDKKGVITTVAGNGTSGYSGDGGPATDAKLFNPSSVAVDAAGNLYIADGGNNCIRKVDVKGIITTLTNDDNPTSYELDFPNSLTVDAAGNLYIADMNGIKKMDKDGIITPVIGEDFGSSGNEFSRTEIFGPYSVAIDLVGNLYVTEKCVVRKATAPIS